jgi:electron transport complex protein RnfD
MTQWNAPPISSDNSDGIVWDSTTGATALDQIRNIKRSVSQSDSAVTEQPDVSSLVLSSPWLWVNVGWLIGGLYLLIRRIITWHIPLSILGTLTVLYLLVGSISSTVILPVVPALFSGAILLGAFFIATDPVSAATSHPAKLLYGAGIGALCFVLREYSIYPEVFAFSVLLMNTCVPLLDHAFTRA